MVFNYLITVKLWIHQCLNIWYFNSQAIPLLKAINTIDHRQALGTTQLLKAISSIHVDHSRTLDKLWSKSIYPCVQGTCLEPNALNHVFQTVINVSPRAGPDTVMLNIVVLCSL
jgi:hypothetical protein